MKPTHLGLAVVPLRPEDFEFVPIAIDDDEPTYPRPDADALLEIIRRLTDVSPYRLVPCKEMRCFYCERRRDEAHAEQCAYLWGLAAVGRRP